MWKIIKDTIKYSFYGLSLLASSLFIAMLCNVAYYHPLWGSADSIAYYVMAIIIVSSGVSFIKHLPAPRTHYTSSSTR